MNTIYDVAIVGAGPAGAYAAYKLSKAGLRIALIESSKHIKRKVCGEYLCPSGVELLVREGLKETIVDQFPRIVGMKIVSSGQKVVQTFFPQISGDQYGIALNRLTFDSQLASLAKENGTKIFMNTKIKSLNREPFGWILQSDSNKVFKARLLIGADGRNSTIAKLLGLKSTVDTSRLALHCHVKPRTKNNRSGEMHLFSDGSYIGIDPTRDDETNISLVCDSSLMGKGMNSHHLLNGYIKSSKELSDYIGEIPADTKINAVTPITNKIDRFTGKNFALIGDAAGFLDPLTGEGMFNGLWMAETLADEITSNSNVSLFNFQAAIDEYDRLKRKFFFQKKILHKVFHLIIRLPRLSEIVANFLKSKQKRADTFVGIIGNIYRPIDGLLRLL